MGTWERQDNGSNQWTPLTSAPVSKWAPSAAGEHGGTPNRHLVGMVVTNRAPLLVAFLAPAPPILSNHCVSRISQNVFHWKWYEHLVQPQWLIWVGIWQGCHHSRASHSRCPGCRIQLQCHHSRASFSQVLRHPTTVFTTPKLQGILFQLSTIEVFSDALAFNYSDHYSWQGTPQWSL